tara:strand:- start:410 stop:1429 length:1020 start_codon:yes stop_codon:yes gene_type:complete
MKNVFIVAELSANHGGKIDIAIDTVKAAAAAGADAIKLQTYKPETMTIDSKKNDFIIKGGTIWDGDNLFKLYQKAFTPWEWHEKLFKVAKENGLICFSTPFDKTSVDFLEKLNNPIYKIASFEITDIPLIKYIASKGRPIIMSTGIANYDDIKLAVDTCRLNGCDDLTVLKCTSSYPAPIDEANLLMMKQIGKDFDVKIGLSDHTMGTTVPIVATSLGATVIEKHIILDKSVGGPDAKFSLDIDEFKEMVTAVRDAEDSIGTISYELTEKQKTGRQFSRSIYVVSDIKKGEIFTEKNIRVIRPGFGLHPKYYENILGKKSTINLQHGDRLNMSVFNDIQ